MALAELQALLSGSESWPSMTAAALSSSVFDPPDTRTLPLGRMVAFNWTRPLTIFGPSTHAGDGTDRSISSVVSVAAGLAPPRIITLGLKPPAGVDGSSTRSEERR